jgi:hypothetical protein
LISPLLIFQPETIGVGVLRSRSTTPMRMRQNRA